MRKEFRTIVGQTVQVTVADERWYVRDQTDSETGLPAHTFVPSVTWIAAFYPKSIGFYKWLAQRSWDESEALKVAAGDKGSVIHQAITDLIDGKTVKMSATYVHPSAGEPAELALEEYEALLAFRDFYAAARPRTILRDQVVWSEEHGYAGMLDWVAWIDADKLPGFDGSPRGWWLIDFKSGQDIWPEHRLQVSAYGRALSEPFEAGRQDSPPVPAEALMALRLGILQVGYRRNQRRWKLTQVEDCFDLFLAAKRIWRAETEGVEVFRAEYPLAITLNGQTGVPAPSPPQPAPKRRGRPSKPKAEQEAML